MLLEDDGGGQRRFQAMCRMVLEHTAKCALRGPFRWRLGVVGKRVEEALDLARCAEPRDDSSFAGGKGRPGWPHGTDRRRAAGGQRACLNASVSSGTVHSFPVNIDRSVPSDADHRGAQVVRHIVRTRALSDDRYAQLRGERLMASGSPVANCQTPDLAPTSLARVRQAPPAYRMPDRS